MEKEAVYIVEISFEAVVVRDRGTENERQELELRTEVASFKDFNKSEAKKRAQDFFDRTIRYGLTKTGKSVVKAVVPPNAIKNIALVDMALFEEEMQEAKQRELLNQVTEEIANENEDDIKNAIKSEASA